MRITAKDGTAVCAYEQQFAMTPFEEVTLYPVAYLFLVFGMPSGSPVI